MIEEDSIIKGPQWQEPVEVKKAEDMGNYIRIVGAMIYSKTYVDELLPKSELTKIKIEEPFPDFSAPADEALLAIEAERYRLAPTYDPLLAVNISKIDPLPFQIEAVYERILKLPRIRFLLADDPGAGKTIMAGLVYKELKIRGLVNRTLIVVPGHLVDQWVRELREKFQEHFTPIDREHFKTHYGINPWEKESRVITSMDFAKQDDILPSLENVRWDLVIVDEAHKMAAYRYGNKSKKTQRYRLGEVLSRKTTHMLFLTATPHKGDPENFRLLLDLLRPGFFTTQKFIQQFLRDEDNTIFIRRLKEDLRDPEGKPLFTKRYPKTIKFRLSDTEAELYNELSHYIVSQYNLALRRTKKERRNVAFALIILQRRMASSTYALLKSLERRRKRLEELLEKRELPSEREEAFVDIDELEDLEESGDLEKETKWETISLAENEEELKKEIEKLSDLIEKAKRIVEGESEIKLVELKRAIEEGFRKIREIGGNEKILIFTEFKDTLDYLVNKIKSWGYQVTFLHGGMSLEERIKAEEEFRHKAKIMVSTDAGSEGTNLQFCHLVINYDIPWNPTRLEQRMGRVHRYGQKKDVHIFNLVAGNTREGSVLSKMLDKLDEIRNTLGSDRVFDVIGDIFQNKNLYRLLQEAVISTRDMGAIVREIDVDENTIKRLRDTVLGESLATKQINYTRMREIIEKMRERGLNPSHVEEFFRRAFEKAGGRIKILGDGFISIGSIPQEIKRIASEEAFRDKHGPVKDKYPKITFYKDLALKDPEAELVTLGHPLFEATLEWVRRKFFLSMRKGAVFEDPSGRYCGIVWIFEGEVRDRRRGIVGRRLILIHDNGERLEEIEPAVLRNLIPSKYRELDGAIDIQASRERAVKMAITIIEKYVEEIRKERERQAEVEKRHLEDLISTLDGELAELYEKQLLGEKVDAEISNKEKVKRSYEENLRKLESEIALNTSLTISTPKLLGAIYVKPSQQASSEKDSNNALEETSTKLDQQTPENILDSWMSPDRDVERKGMEVAMEYERRQGREPKDVSREKNLGYDIESRGGDEIRYIEVKARAEKGPVILTYPEWLAAKRLRDKYWLYVVFNAASKPILRIINNPSEKLNVKRVTLFLVPLEELEKKGVEVS
ncbi:MAG: helicase [Desulfurococcaceae archaeon]|nr:MAG: helicase [Desulfurococcaceae archaeon]